MIAEKLLWSADFSRDGRPDANDWGYEMGGGGWGNNEAQEYTDRLENAYVKDGVLHIRAQKEADGRYTSARLITFGKHELTYGRIAVEAKLPAGSGTWPAIWMLGNACMVTGDWPRCGEIDIMEHVGWDMNHVHASLHTQTYNHMNNSQRTAQTMVEDVAGSFHTYEASWDGETLCFLIDGRLISQYRRGENGTDPGEDGWPFGKPYYLILNVALAGWGGKVDDSVLPTEMVVRGVRMYGQA